jgi:predicted molibdopterin-dependent oxidoreductase YjgC
LPDNLPGYQGLGSEAIQKFEKAWGGTIPDAKGLVVTEMVESIDKLNGIKAMYITGENPLLSEPDLNHAEKLFSQLEFLVVQDIFLHETAEIADVVLPATSYAEKDGTFTNSERRVQRIRKAIDPIGNSRPDWEIISDLGRRINNKLSLGLESQFSFNSPKEIFDEMSDLTPIIKGINYDRLETGGVQWPCPSYDHPGTSYLYAETFPRGQYAKFVGYDQGPIAAETPSKRFPLMLNTGRVLYHWHGGTITRRVDNLMARSPELEISINPEDADNYGVVDGQKIKVSSRRGELVGQALLTEKMRRGEVFIPFVKLSESAANFLTNSAYDPDSKIPEYKVCAVRLDSIET